MCKRGCVLLVVAVLLTVSVLTGCQSVPGTTPGSSSNEVPDVKETINLRIWRTVREQAWTDYFISVCERYNNSQTGVVVQTQEIPSAEFDTKLNAAYASGTEPEIVSTGLYNIAPRAELGQFAPLDEYFNAWDEKDDILDSIIELGQYKGKLYGMGFFPDPKVFFYRKDYFEEAGLDPEKPPKTWEELKECAVKLTIKEGDKIIRSGFDINPSDWYVTYSLILQNGGDIIDLDKMVPTLDSPEVIEALEFLTLLL